MEKENLLYEDEYFYITNCKEFPNVPGLVTIITKVNPWYNSNELIKRLALIEKTIREELMKYGFELVGIYREEYDEDKLRILIIPYNIKVLEQNDISPDLYQPYIRRYLESFNNNKYLSNDLSKKILKKVKLGVDFDVN